MTLEPPALAPVLASLVGNSVTELSCFVCVSSLYREIGQKCAQELSRDTAGAKGFAAFLTELAERIPEVLMSSMCILLDHLDGEVVCLGNLRSV